MTSPAAMRSATSGDKVCIGVREICVAGIEKALHLLFLLINIHQLRSSFSLHHKQ